MERAFRFALFLTVVLGIWSLVHVYVLSRAVPLLIPHAPRRLVLAAGLFLGGSYLIARVLDRGGFWVLGQPLEVLAGAWMGVLFFAFWSFLLADAVTGLGRFFPPAPARAGALALTALLAIAATVQGLRPPAVREEEVALRGLPPALDGARVVLVSDLHLGAVLGRRWLERRVQQVNDLSPRVVVVCGDLIDGDVRRVAPLVPQLKRLLAPLGVFAVSGNHEVYAGLDASARLMREAGFRVLRDEWTEAAPGLVLAGVDDLTARRQAGLGGGDPVGSALAGRPANGATIFLSHTPWRAEQAARLGAGLMLSGHTHAGQLFPFGFLVKLQYPLLAGTYHVAGMPVVVCRGTGTWGPRMRLFSRSEIVSITLRAA